MTGTLSPTVTSLCRAIDDGDDSVLPILADALEDAGCEDTSVLQHLRGPGPHVRGCWVLDWLLRRE